MYANNCANDSKNYKNNSMKGALETSFFQNLNDFSSRICSFFVMRNAASFPNTFPHSRPDKSTANLPVTGHDGLPEPYSSARR